MAESNGESIPQWVKDMVSNGHTSFYKVEAGKQKYYDMASGEYQLVPGSESAIILANLGEKPVYSNAKSIPIE